MAINGGLDAGKTETREVYLEMRWKQVKLVEGGKTARLIASAPSNLLTYRRFSLPFSERKKIRETVKEELVDSLAFPIDESTWDFCSTARGDTFVVIGKTKEINEVKSSLGKTIEMLDAEPLALARSAVHCGIKDTLIIDFGASKTVFCGLRDGFVDLVKVLLRGGEALTADIADTRKISLDEAEQLKRSKGMNLPEVRAAIIKLLRASGIATPFPYPSILITGRGALLAGLPEFLQDTLKATIAHYTLPEGLSPFIHPVAFGLALKEKDHDLSVNLMEEKKKEINPVKLWIAGLAIPLLLYSVNLKITESTLDNQVKMYRTEMQNVFKKEFPDVKTIISPLKQFQAAYKEKKALLEDKGSDLLTILEGISKVVDQKDIHIFEIDMNETTITLTGEAASYQEVELMRQRLLKTFKTVELQEGKTLPSRRITFTMIIKQKGAESEKT
jgi:hypothetical protein